MLNKPSSVAIPKGRAKINEEIKCCASYTLDFNIMVSHAFKQLETNEKYRKDKLMCLDNGSYLLYIYYPINPKTHCLKNKCSSYFTITYELVNTNEARIIRISTPDNCPKKTDKNFICSKNS